MVTLYHSLVSSDTPDFSAFYQIYISRLLASEATLFRQFLGHNRPNPFRIPKLEIQNLRTVIVTAAVHRGFSSHREALPLTFRHRAGVSPYTSTFVLAETCVFDKQFLGLFCCNPQKEGGPYPEVTVAVLPSSLAKVLS